MHQIQESYYVPTTLLVLAPVSFPPKLLANPKSEILGFISESNNILLAFRSLWIILSRESWWRYRRPRAMPLMMLKRFGQSRHLLSNGSVNQHECEKIEMSSTYLWILERGVMFTEKNQVEASIRHILIDQKVFFSTNAAAQKLHQIPVLKLCNADYFVLELVYSLERRPR